MPGRWDPSDWAFFTDPGCDDPRHREEIRGAMMALWISGPWKGITRMDCGCTLELIPNTFDS